MEVPGKNRLHIPGAKPDSQILRNLQEWLFLAFLSILAERYEDFKAKGSETGQKSGQESGKF